ncbi:hypothetical protein [Microlunatus ginsengisoli]|uniref:Uncharacterized protein n=1 Tax=Microlunatus ginsengisoli TaxID=363863 RepID=A0ABP7AHU6_9ACTN
MVQRADVRDATVVDAGATIPAIGNAASLHLNAMAGTWGGGGSAAEYAAKLAYLVALPSIATIATDLRRTAAETGAAADDLQISYNAALGDHGVALTNYHAPAQWTEINIEIGPSAFASGPLLYSTIRHELIHAAQHRRTDAKEQHWGGNVDVISNSTNVEFNLGSYQPYSAPANVTQTNRNDYYRALDLAISEMETHRWEYQNAAATGHNSNADRKDRGEWWIHYADDWLDLTTRPDTVKKTPDPTTGVLSMTRYLEYVAHATNLLPTPGDRHTIALL